MPDTESRGDHGAKTNSVTGTCRPALSLFAGFERRLFSTEVICTAAALFNLVVLFAHF